VESFIPFLIFNNSCAFDFASYDVDILSATKHQRKQQSFQQKLLEAVSFVVAKQGFELKPRNQSNVAPVNFCYEIKIAGVKLLLLPSGVLQGIGIVLSQNVCYCEIERIHKYEYPKNSEYLEHIIREVLPLLNNLAGALYVLSGW